MRSGARAVTILRKHDRAGWAELEPGVTHLSRAGAYGGAMLARIATFAIDGIDPRHVWVEVDIRSGLPAFTIVGLGDAAVRESRDRVRSAIMNSGYEFPQTRITANLAPAFLRKVGPGFDAALAIGVLAASEQVPAGVLSAYAVFGELSLGGELRDSPGALAVAEGARRAGLERLIVPRERERLMRFQQAELAGHPDTTFSGNAEFTSTPSANSTDPALRQTALDTEVEQALPDEIRVDNPTLHSHDTVGAVALDSEGRLAAGTSTGGTLSKAPGRVGDSSLIGCGCYADNDSAAVSLTGWGEPIMKLVLGKWAVDRVAAGSSPQEAATGAIDYLFNRLGGHGGIILLGPDGSLGLAHNTPRMAWGIATADGRQFGTTRND